MTAIEIARATAAYAESIGFFRTDKERLLEIMVPAWEEFSDLEETPVGVALMLQLALGTVRVDDQQALAWLERLLPIAERLDLLPETAAGLSRLSSTLWRLGRPRQGLMILRGTSELAISNGLTDVDRNTRTSLTFYEQFADPVAGLALAREGLEVASRRGSKVFGFLMVGNAVCLLDPGRGVGVGEGPARRVDGLRDHR